MSESRTLRATLAPAFAGQGPGGQYAGCGGRRSHQAAHDSDSYTCAAPATAGAGGGKKQGTGYGDVIPCGRDDQNTSCERRSFGQQRSRRGCEVRKWDGASRPVRSIKAGVAEVLSCQDCSGGGRQNSFTALCSEEAVSCGKCAGKDDFPVGSFTKMSAANCWHSCCTEMRNIGLAPAWELLHLSHNMPATAYELATLIFATFCSVQHWKDWNVPYFPRPFSAGFFTTAWGRYLYRRTPAQSAGKGNGPRAFARSSCSSGSGPSQRIPKVESCLMLAVAHRHHDRALGRLW